MLFCDKMQARIFASTTHVASFRNLVNLYFSTDIYLKSPIFLSDAGGTHSKMVERASRSLYWQSVYHKKRWIHSLRCFDSLKYRVSCNQILSENAHQIDCAAESEPY